MNAKRLMSAIVAMILIVCTLLTSCNTGDPVVTTTEPSDVTTATPDGTTTDGSSTTTQKPDGTTVPDNTTGSGNTPGGDPADNCKHENTSKTNVKDATCVLKGYTGDDVCTACGTIVNKGQETDLIDHVYDNGKITKEPTCIEEGTLTYTCTGCGTTKTSSISKVPHKDVYHDALDGTHNHTCENCTISDNAVHTPKDSGVKHEATCDSAEYIEHTCSLCNGVYKVYTEGSKALGCSYGDWSVTKDATCSEDGEMTRSCTRCGNVETIPVPKNDASHSYKLTNTFAASCTDEGSERYTCEYCGDAYTVTIPKLPHNYVSEETGNDGWTHKICECGYKLSTFDAKNLIEAEVKTDAIPENNSFEVSLEKADIVFPDSVVSQFKGSDSADLSIKADVMSDDNKNALINAQGSNLTEEQKNRLNDVPVYDFGVKIGGSYVESFESEVTVTLPYELKDGEDPEGITVWYVQEDGTIQNVQAKYDAETETVSFSVAHFSFYAIAYEETQEMRCKRGNHAYYATPVRVEASCTQHGYTLYECECCHYKNISDIVEKLTHNYGDVINPQVSCTDGGYTHRICADCGDIVNIDYIRATGHTPGAAATCDTPCVCTVCGDVIIPAKSHKFSDWETVKQPTGSEAGLKRRYCTNCGKSEEKEIPPTGLAEKIEFESASEFYNYIFRDLLGMENGTISFVMAQTQGTQKMTMKYVVTVESNSDGNYSILVEQTRIMNNGNTTNSATMYALVRNGMAFSIEPGENGSYVYVNVMDSPGAAEDIAEDLYRSMSMMNEGFTVLFECADAFVTIGKLFPEQMNGYIDSLGLEMDVEELEAHINTLKAEFVYLMSLFSVDSEIEYADGTVIGGINNIVSVITDMMTSNGNGKYSYALSALIGAGKELVDTYDKYAELPLTEVIYDFIKEDLTAKMPELTSWALCEAKIRESFPGTMKVSEAFDNVMTSICDNDSAKLESLYEAINQFATAVMGSGEEFDIEALVLEYADYTLDRFAQENFELASFKECLDNVFASMGEVVFKEILGSYRHTDVPNYPEVPSDKEYASGTASGEIVVKPSEPSTPSDPSEPSVDPVVPSEPVFVENEFITALRQYVYCAEFTDESGIEITVDANGALDLIVGNAGITVYMDSETGDPVFIKDVNPATPDKYVVGKMDVDLEIDFNNGAKVTLPSQVESVKDLSIKYDYDENGNIVITLNGTDAELDFRMNGHAYVNFVDSLVKDETMSKEKGFDVFVSTGRNEYEESIGYPHELALYNGKLYTLTTQWEQSYYEIIAKASLKDIMASPDVLLNFDVTENDGYVEIGGERLPVYESAFGLVYQQNGEWMLINDQYLDYDYRHEEYYDKETDEYYHKEYKLWYNYNGELVSAKLSEVISTISFSNSEEDYNSSTIKENGQNVSYDFQRLYFTVDHEKWGDYTICLIGYYAVDGTIMIVDHRYRNGDRYYVLGDVKDPSEFGDDFDKREEQYDYKLYDKNGNLISDGFTMIRYYEYFTIPTYYVKVGDTCIRLNNLTAIATFNYDSITLPDSTKLYVVYNEGDTTNGIIYGYTHVVENLYAETACIFENGVLTDTVYRHQSGTYYTHFDEETDDISSYITKNGSTYTVSAELIKKYSELCENSVGYAYFNLSARGEWLDTATSTSFTVSLSLYNMSVEPDHSEDNYYNLDWYRAFENASYDNYTVYVNDDGSISLFFRDGGKIKLELRGERWVKVDENLITPDTSLSQSTGLPVGSATIPSEHYSTYLHIDGKYYEYYTYSVLTADTVFSIADLVKDNIKVNNLYYRYDFDAGNGNVYKVFNGSFTISPTDYFWQKSIELFVTVIDGKLMVLRGAEELGESVLKFEEIVALDEYFNSLIYVTNSYSYGMEDVIHVNGGLREIYSEYVNVYETADDAKSGNSIGSFRAYYYNGSNGKVYLKKLKHTDKDEYIKKGSLVSLPDNVVEIIDREMVAYNGIFTIANVYYLVYETNTYIKIDGTYYYYDSENYWATYENCKLTENQVMKEFADFTWKYAVWMYTDANGWAYYLCDFDGYQKDYVVISNIGEKVDDYGDSNYIGTTIDGYEVYELSTYTMPENLTTETRNDGTVFYSKDNSDTGFIKCPDGYYLHAERITNSDGSTHVVCTDIEKAMINVDDETLASYFDSCITYTENGSVVTISKDIVDVIGKLYDHNIYDIRLEFNFSTDRYSAHFDISEILRYMGY